MVNKIVITRPVVEAGERLGFLPGDLKEKIDPYLTPIYDALNEMIKVYSNYFDISIMDPVHFSKQNGSYQHKCFITVLTVKFLKIVVYALALTHQLRFHKDRLQIVMVLSRAF